MSGETSAPHRILHLVIEGFPPARLEEITGSADGADGVTEIFQLTEASAPEALKKIFAADGIAVWGSI